MPVRYAGILQEHDAVRARAGLFDLSHMAQFVLRGDGVAAWADRLTVNAVASMRPGGARYNLFCNDAGGTHDDVIFYRLHDRWLLVCNAANADKMWALLAGAGAPNVTLEDRREGSALIALQGPRSVDVLAPLVEDSIAALRYYGCTESRVCGRSAIVARTGYTGEDGFELFVEAEDAAPVWEAVLARGASYGVEPAGLGARDVLRLEAGMALYGHELDEEITPLQAGLDWTVKFAKGDFAGKAALERQRDDGRYARIAGIVMDGKVPAREGYEVIHNGTVVGAVRSGSIGPSVGRNIATALVPPEVSQPGTRLGIRVRGAEHPAEVVKLPFYRRK